ncbi:xaa-Pro aminopeptidase 1-like isoform X2 [Liolophura sinensis]|uniref:xaa-Pro aminopeptidase 1-like isoform X2 n=1 Tax=Liolophura sinensis TaxID=3198878 RepID=UPI003158D878
MVTEHNDTIQRCVQKCHGVPKVEDRETCASGYSGPVPATRVNTSQRLQRLRQHLRNNSIDAYIISSEDAHASEYVSDYDARREYISGFSGSAGTAVVTADKAALWTDGRYFLQADEQLDCNWILMKAGQPNVPTTYEWLEKELSNGQAIGASSYNNPIGKLISKGQWLPEIQELLDAGIQFRPIDNDLVDAIWTTGRPAIPAGPVEIHPISFAGKNWSEKVGFVRNHLSAANVTALVVTGLDETAWLFNLRGADIPYNPFFISYAIVEMDRVRLYLRDHSTKLSSQDLQTHLNTNADGSCTGKQGNCVEVKNYNSMKADVAALAMQSSTRKIWISHSCNYAIYNSIDRTKAYQKSSPIALMKAVKNSVERQGMKNSHIRDAVALISFMQRLEKEVKEGKPWTEVSAAMELKKYREKQDYMKGLSFPSISGFGSNGAIIHYKPSNVTDRTITTEGMYLLDSGGQYLDGTTDVTRTFHFGTPTDFEKEAYTLVLMGAIDLALLKWPAGLYGRDLDAVTRAPLWKAGLIYNHGTGHGIGAYLSVHEGPGRISLGYRETTYESKLYDGMFFSDEPGYYEDGKFGVRLETIVEIVYVSTKYQYKNTKFLGFNPITLVPFEPHLINVQMMSAEQISWLNAYHKKVMDIVGKRLKDEGLTDAYKWVEARVKPYEMPTFPSSPATTVTCSVFVVMVTSVLTLFQCSM